MTLVAGHFRILKNECLWEKGDLVVAGIQRQRETFSWRFAAELPMHLPGDRPMPMPQGFPGTQMDWAKRTADLDALSKRLNDEGFDSRKIWGMGKDPHTGRTIYHPDRVAQHQQIVNEFIKEMEGIPQQRRAVLMAGLGGAGKTSLRHNDWANIPLDQYFDVSADKVKDKMADMGMMPTGKHDPRLKGYSPMELSGLTHMESNDIAQMVAEEAAKRGTNVVWDYRMGDLPSALSRIKHLNGHGYKDIGAFLVNVTPETAQGRAIGRHRQGQQQLLQQGTSPGIQGGRWFPTWAQASNDPTPGSGYTSSSHEAFDQLTRNHSDLLPMGWAAVDNNTEPIALGGSGQWAHLNDMAGQTLPRKDQ